MGTWEVVLIATVILVLLFAVLRRRPGGADPDRSPASAWGDLLLWVAQGFGIGRIPIAPGTFGSLLGVLWLGLLLETHNPWALLCGALAGIALSIWLCDAAERILRQKDPGSVVLDEIAAMPVCFFAWIGILFFRTGTLPSFESLLSGRNWPLALGVFALFRFFDVVKPWPVRQSQSLPGGWGITVDDALAAVYVNAVTLLIYSGKILLTK